MSPESFTVNVSLNSKKHAQILDENKKPIYQTVVTKDPTAIFQRMYSFEETATGKNIFDLRLVPSKVYNNAIEISKDGVPICRVTGYFGPTSKGFNKFEIEPLGQHAWGHEYGKVDGKWKKGINLCNSSVTMSNMHSRMRKQSYRVTIDDIKHNNTALFLALTLAVDELYIISCMRQNLYAMATAY